jgi:hypothetical protein
VYFVSFFSDISLSFLVLLWQIDFMALSSYSGSTRSGIVRIVMDMRQVGVLFSEYLLSLTALELFLFLFF